jgi:hypothetical protein
MAVAQLMTALDATIVNIAPPSAQRSRGFDDACGTVRDDDGWRLAGIRLSPVGVPAAPPQQPASDR